MDESKMKIKNGLKEKREGCCLSEARTTQYSYSVCDIFIFSVLSLKKCDSK